MDQATARTSENMINQWTIKTTLINHHLNALGILSDNTLQGPRAEGKVGLEARKSTATLRGWEGWSWSSNLLLCRDNCNWKGPSSNAARHLRKHAIFVGRFSATSSTIAQANSLQQGFHNIAVKYAESSHIQTATALRNPTQKQSLYHCRQQRRWSTSRTSASDMQRTYSTWMKLGYTGGVQYQGC